MINKNWYLCLFIVLIGSLSQSCHDDELPIVCDYPPQEIAPCEEIGFDLISVPTDTCYETNAVQYERVSPFYQYPVYNPSNPNEFAYYRAEVVNENLYDYQLCKANLCSEKIDILHTWTTTYPLVGFAATINWGENDWITFNTENDNQLSLIRSNGDSLRVFSETTQTTSILSWITDTTFFGDLVQNGLPTRGALFHINGTTLDTLNNTGNIYECQYIYNQLFFSKNDELFHKDIMIDEEQFILDIGSNDIIRDFSFYTENDLFLLTNKYLYNTNIDVLEFDTLVTYCDRIKHFKFSKHKNRTDFLMYYSQTDLIGDSLFVINYKVTLYNPETGEEQILDLE